MTIEDNPETRACYGQWLHDRRTAAGLTQEELSQRVIMSRTHIAHIEAGRRMPSPEDARRLDQVLDTKGVCEAFLPKLKNTQIAEHFQEAAELERVAVAIRSYAPALVPGILQTEEYARVVLGSGYPAKTDDEREELLRARLLRSRLLDRFSRPEFWVLFDESVLHRPIGGPAVMAEQLRRIVELGDSRRIRCHVLPYSVGFHALLAGFVWLMWFEDLPPMAYLEGLMTGKVWDTPSVVQRCQAAYDHALGDALSHEKSVALIRSLAEDYEHEAQ